MKRLKEWLAEYRRARALRIIRETFKDFGYDFSELSDKEIEVGLFKTCELMKSSDVELEEAQEALSKFATAAIACGEIS